MARILEGREVAAALSGTSRGEIRDLRAIGVVPTLAIVRVGERGGDMAYERGAMKRCESVGVNVKNFTLAAGTNQAELLSVIKEINEDSSVHGCLLLRPLPKEFDDNLTRNSISARKDVDGVTDRSLGGVFTGTKIGFPPCTASACLEILDHYAFELEGKRAVVAGRSLVVGRPAAMMLMERNSTVTICHTRTRDMASLCREADILIAAIGRAGIINGDFLRPGQVVIDVGINVGADGKIQGDVPWEDAQRAEAVTPVPGGVGVVTTSVLVKNVAAAARNMLNWGGELR
jgi:methylenetetrahydrofolate dehydrogenase (NADP+)/methenyltetrahydrofolate cyclohydrolase